MTNSTFTQALHILSKDVRHLRLQIGILYFLALTFWASYLQDTIAPEWSLFVNLGFFACLSSLIYAATKEDSVTNSSTWWATRPISPVALFISKLMLWFTTVAVPLTISAAAVASKFQFTGAETLLAIIEVTLVTAIAAGAVAVLSSIGGLGMGFGMLLGALFLLFLVGSLVSIQAPRGFNATGLPAVPFRESSLALGLIVLTLASLGAWGLRIIRRSQGLSIGILVTGFAFFAVSTIGAFQLGPRFRLDPADEARINVKLLDTPTQFPSDRQPAQLYSHFAFEGLATNEFVALDWIDATFQWPNGYKGRTHDLGTAPGTSNHQFERRILSQLQPLLLRHFPQDATWHSEWNNRRSDMFPISHPDRDYSTSSKTTGDFEGNVQAQILRLVPVKKLPLTPGIYPLDSGRSLDVQASEPQWDSVRVNFSLTWPRLAMSKSHESGLVTPYVSEDTRYVFTIYHPTLKEGYLLENSAPNRHRVVPLLIPTSKQAFQYRVPFSSLQSAINGLKMSEWLEEVELHVFKIEMVGIKAYAFSKPDYRPYQYNNSYSTPPSETLTNLTLAPNASPAEVETFIKSVLSQIPERYSNEAILAVRSKIESIGAEHLPILLEHLPHDDSIVNSYLLRPVTKLMKPEHLPAFKKLWAERDLFLTEIRRRRWSDQVRDVLIPRVKTRSPISPIAVAIAAESNDPEIHDDLRWHFVKSRWGHETMLRSFKNCEGLELESMIRETWKRARLDIINPDGVALAAAALGLPDALRLARDYMEKLEGDRRTGVAKEMRAMTNYSGPDDSFEAWFGTHFGELQFDPESKKYRTATE